MTPRSPLKLLLIFIGALTPAIAQAAIFPSPPTDVSTYYLGLIFGSVTGVLAPDLSNPLLGHLFRQFNFAILSVGGLILSYGTITSAINTAQEGQFLGQRWSSAMVPLRAIFGFGLLIPTASGYSTIQLLVMWIILQGVGFANMIWEDVLANYEAGYSISLPNPIQHLDQANEALFRSAVCAQYNMTLASGKTVPVLVKETTPESERNDPPRRLIGKSDLVTIYQPIGDPSKVYVGLADKDGRESHLCGQIDLFTLSHLNASEQASMYSDQYQAFRKVFEMYQTAAREAAQSPIDSVATRPVRTVYWTQKGILSSGKLILESYFADIKLRYSKPNNLRAQVSENAKKNGWILAGAYYRELVGKAAASGTTISSIPVLDADSVPSGDLNPAKPNRKGPDGMKVAVFQNYYDRANTYIEYSESNAYSPGTGSISLPKRGGGMPEPFGKIFQPIFGGITSYVTKNVSGGKGQDPLLRIAYFGQSLMALIENLWFSAVGVAAVLAFVSSFVTWSQPMGHVVQVLIKIVIPLITAMMLFLWAPAAMMGVLLPLIPFIYFSLGAIQWLVLCVEAMAAGPIIALGFATPSQEEYGKSMHSLMLLFNLFLRPALLLFGFVFGARLAITIFEMLNYGFTAALNEAVGTLGLFGAIAIVLFYAGICHILITECFAPIYLLPDRVIRWIGGVAEQTASSITSGAQEVESKQKQGDEIAVSASSAIAKKLSEKLEQEDDDKESSEGGEKGKDGGGNSGGGGGAGGGGTAAGGGGA